MPTSFKNFQVHFKSKFPAILHHMNEILKLSRYHNLNPNLTSGKRKIATWIDCCRTGKRRKQLDWVGRIAAFVFSALSSENKEVEFKLKFKKSKLTVKKVEKPSDIKVSTWNSFPDLHIRWLSLTWSLSSISCFDNCPTRSCVFSSWFWRLFTSNWSPSPSAVSSDVARNLGNLKKSSNELRNEF